MFRPSLAFILSLGVCDVLAGRIIESDADALWGVLFILVIVAVQGAFWMVCRTFPRLVDAVGMAFVYLCASAIFMVPGVFLGLLSREAGTVGLVLGALVAWCLNAAIARQRAAREQQELDADPVHRRLMEEADKVGRPPSDWGNEEQPKA